MVFATKKVQKFSFALNPLFCKHDVSGSFFYRLSRLSASAKNLSPLWSKTFSALSI